MLKGLRRHSADSSIVTVSQQRLVVLSPWQSESSAGKVSEELLVLSLCGNLEEGGFDTSHTNLPAK